MTKFKNPTTGEVIEQEESTPQSLADKGFSPVASNTIESSSLETNKNLNFNTPEEQNVFPVAGLDATPPKPIEPTAPEAELPEGFELDQ